MRPAWCCCSGRLRSRSAVADRLEVVVGLDDFAQLVLGRAVAAVRIRMMALHQRLEPCLHILGRRVGIEPERVERLALGVAHAARLRPLGTAARAATEVAKYAERIDGVGEFRLEARRMRACGRPPAVHAHLPGRTMPDHRVLLIARDVVGAHPGEEIIAVIVLPHVLKAEPPILALAVAPFRRAVASRRLAIRPFAGRRLGAHAAILIGLDPNTIKKGRVAFHDRSV